MSHWQHIGPVLAGGEVFSLAAHAACDGDCPTLAGTAVGLHRSMDGGRSWRPLSAAITGFPVTAVTTAPGRPEMPAIFVGGAPGTVIRSPDGGQSWDPRALDFPDVIVNVLTVSPSFSEDGIVLAGTLEDGIYRSTTEGRYWEASNFGLYDLSVWDLAMSPAWEADQTAFAIVGNRLFRSTNGARAWKAIAQELEEMGPLAIGLSPGFASDSTVLLSTEGHGIWRSLDAGASWHRVPLTDELVINCLAYSSTYEQDRTIYAGTVRQGVVWSQDAGESWTRLGALDATVLALREIASAGSRVLLASAGDEGVRRLELGARQGRPSEQEQAWEPASEGLAARPISMLATPADPSGGSVLVAGGGTGLLLRSDDAGHAWQQLDSEIPGEPGIRCLSISPAFTDDGVILIGVPQGILRSGDGGVSWATPDVQESLANVHAIAFSPGFVDDHTVWACAGTRSLLKSTDSGHSWTVWEPPLSYQSVNSLVLSPSYPLDRTVFVGTAARAGREVVLRVWRSTDDGRHWRQMLEQGAAAPQIVLAAASSGGDPGGPFDQLFVGIGNQVFCPPASGEEDWQGRALPDGTAQVLSLVVTSERGERQTILAGATRGLFISRDDGLSWQQPKHGPGRYPIMALALSANYTGDRSTWVLAVGGDLWRFTDTD